jgi:hypothetical protein
MNVTARFAVLTAASVVFATDRINAEEPTAPVKPGVSSNAVNVAGTAFPLTNKALLVISKLRGVEPAKVKIRTSAGGAGGAFEIDIVDAKDAAKEAEELSKEFGAAAAVILEHVSDDGIIRTNWTFKSGTVRQLTAPVGASGLKPRARRMYVWPTTAALRPPAAPTKLRVRDTIN